MERYLAIIKVLNDCGPTTQEQIMNMSGLHLDPTKEYLNFLTQSQIVKERTLQTKTTYSLTQKGQRILSYLSL